MSEIAAAGRTVYWLAIAYLHSQSLSPLNLRST